MHCKLLCTCNPQLIEHTEEIIRISARVSFTTFTLIFMGLHTSSEYVSPALANPFGYRQ